ncbi:hypothetical protein Golax_017900, partial [Gossypium laxum]|nr:hypothetical protein [Gossypium laxum]
MSLSRELPESFGHLKFLMGLALLFSNFSRSIPQSLGNLTQLEFLVLSYNYFSGKVPSSLANLTKLRILSLDDNQLEGCIPNNANVFPNLRYLDLSDNLVNFVDNLQHYQACTRSRDPFANGCFEHVNMGHTTSSNSSFTFLFIASTPDVHEEMQNSLNSAPSSASATSPSTQPAGSNTPTQPPDIKEDCSFANAFIPQKRSRSGKQFGFVRYASMVNARGALYRLNGFHWLGKRIQVSLAKFKSHSKFWRRHAHQSRQQASHEDQAMQELLERAQLKYRGLLHKTQAEPVYSLISTPTLINKESDVVPGVVDEVDPILIPNLRYTHVKWNVSPPILVRA